MYIFLHPFKKLSILLKVFLLIYCFFMIVPISLKIDGLAFRYYHILKKFTFPKTQQSLIKQKYIT